MTETSLAYIYILFSPFLYPKKHFYKHSNMQNLVPFLFSPCPCILCPISSPLVLTSQSCSRTCGLHRYLMVKMSLPFQSLRWISYCKIQRTSRYSSSCNFSSLFQLTTYSFSTWPLLASRTLCSSSFLLILLTSLSPPTSQCNSLRLLCSREFSLDDLRHFPSHPLPSEDWKSVCVSYGPRHHMHTCNSLLGMHVLLAFQIPRVQNEVGLRRRT